MQKVELTKILAECDPEQLVCYGAPKNEYAGEAEEIAEAIGSSDSVGQIEMLLCEVFQRNFDYSYVQYDKPESVAFTRHAIGKVRFEQSQEFKLKGQHEANSERAGCLRAAAEAIFKCMNGG